MPSRAWQWCFESQSASSSHCTQNPLRQSSMGTPNNECPLQSSAVRQSTQTPRVSSQIGETRNWTHVWDDVQPMRHCWVTESHLLVERRQSRFEVHTHRLVTGSQRGAVEGHDRSTRHWTHLPVSGRQNGAVALHSTLQPCPASLATSGGSVGAISWPASLGHGKRGGRTGSDDDDDDGCGAVAVDVAVGGGGGGGGGGSAASCSTVGTVATAASICFDSSVGLRPSPIVSRWQPHAMRPPAKRADSRRT